MSCCSAKRLQTADGLHTLGTELWRVDATPIAQRKPRAQAGTASQVLCQDCWWLFWGLSQCFGSGSRQSRGADRQQPRAERRHAAPCSGSSSCKCTTQPAPKHCWLKTRFATSPCAGLVWSTVHPALGPAPASTGWNLPTEIAVN